MQDFTKCCLGRCVEKVLVCYLLLHRGSATVRDYFYLGLHRVGRDHRGSPLLDSNSRAYNNTYLLNQRRLPVLSTDHMYPCQYVLGSVCYNVCGIKIGFYSAWDSTCFTPLQWLWFITHGRHCFPREQTRFSQSNTRVLIYGSGATITNPDVSQYFPTLFWITLIYGIYLTHVVDSWFSQGKVFPSLICFHL